MKDAARIALFYGQFISVVDVFGGEWDVKAVKEGAYWLIYPAKESSFVPIFGLHRTRWRLATSRCVMSKLCSKF